MRIPPGENGIEEAGISNIALLERSPLHGTGMSTGHIIDDDDGLKPPRRQSLAGMPADMAGPAGDDDGGHLNSISFYNFFSTPRSRDERS